MHVQPESRTIKILLDVLMAAVPSEKIIVQHEKHSTHVLSLMKRETGCRWIEIRSRYRYIFLVKTSRVRDRSWASNAFTSLSKQVRVNRAGNVQDGGIPGLDNRTCIPSHLHFIDNEETERFVS